jgi:hypothetical protein
MGDAPVPRSGPPSRDPSWEPAPQDWISTQTQAFPLPAAPPGGSLRVDGLLTDMPSDGLLLLSRGRHRIQMRDAVGVLLLDTIWLADVPRGAGPASTSPAERTTP